VTITGTPFSDAIRLSLAPGDPATAQVFVDNNDAADLSFPVAGVRAIVLDGGRGDDRLSLDTSHGAFPDAVQIVLFGGAGDDEVFGGLGHQVLLGGLGNDTIDGDQGADDQFGGPGNDTIIWDPGDGSDLVDGGFGFDTMLFNGSDLAEIFRAVQSDNGVTFTRNLGTIVMDVRNTERIDLREFRGNDALTVENISNTALRQIDVDLAGDGFADSVTVNGSAAADTFHIAASAGAVEVSRAGAATTRITGADAPGAGFQSDSLDVEGLGGTDTFDVGAGVNALIGLTTND
jgi:RTX calcium-binding nonapeptide repeat (4 copies)